VNSTYEKSTLQFYSAIKFRKNSKLQKYLKYICSLYTGQLNLGKVAILLQTSRASQ